MSMDFEDLFENAPCGYVLLDSRGRIALTNETLLTWLDLPRDTLVGRRFLDLLPAGGRIFYETHFAPLLRMQGFFHEVALDFSRADGSRIPVLANAVQKTDEHGEVLQTRIAVFQATSRRKYERELCEAQQAADGSRKELESMNRALTETGRLREEFVAILGHDLRNPLASIGSGTRILGKEELSPRGRQVLGLIDHSVERMGKLISDILDFTRGRLGGGLVVIRTRETELGKELEQVVAEIGSASGRKIHCRIDLPSATFVDVGRIAQLASNLLGNAVVHGAEDNPVELVAFMDGQDIVISVSNYGEPIPSEIKERLFQPFFRGPDSTGKHEQGLGLGLHIANEIAKAHGGILSVNSSFGKTAFEFRMPNVTDGSQIAD